MCAVSAIYDYGKSISHKEWIRNEELINQFKKLLEQAHEFDKKTGQPDCEDPEKMKWWNAIEEVK